MTAFSPLAFIELAVVAAFAVAWAILELVCRRLDRQRSARPEVKEDQNAAPRSDADIEN
ncbi:hypothetical protein [Hyphomicrobium zavarzinii]|jgi:hypothetical protein|uniref:hypothetical protein n=1 Tax=Hyphomicrobium zavarzinii TaxID=48292 RepID=UPI000364DAE1|nr:hypothetical protein [Hyphomicrobium zavarzinii]